jgi:hypothetical protein
MKRQHERVKTGLIMNFTVQLPLGRRVAADRCFPGVLTKQKVNSGVCGTFVRAPARIGKGVLHRAVLTATSDRTALAHKWCSTQNSKRLSANVIFIITNAIEDFTSHLLSNGSVCTEYLCHIYDCDNKQRLLP